MVRTDFTGQNGDGGSRTDGLEPGHPSSSFLEELGQGLGRLALPAITALALVGCSKGSNKEARAGKIHDAVTEVNKVVDSLVADVPRTDSYQNSGMQELYEELYAEGRGRESTLPTYHFVKSNYDLTHAAVLRCVDSLVVNSPQVPSTVSMLERTKTMLAVYWAAEDLDRRTAEASGKFDSAEYLLGGSNESQVGAGRAFREFSVILEGISALPPEQRVELVGQVLGSADLKNLIAKVNAAANGYEHGLPDEPYWDSGNVVIDAVRTLRIQLGKELGLVIDDHTGADNVSHHPGSGMAQ